MPLEIILTDGPIDTQYAPLAVLFAHYQENQVLEPLDQVQMAMKKREFSSADKLRQVLLSMLAGCATLSEVNSRLKPEIGLARVWGWERLADQSTLSRTLDALTLKQIEQLRQSTTAIWRAHSQVKVHDRRGYLWLDFDLSGLPCSAQAEESQRGYFSDKKTPPDANWPVSVRSATAKRSGRTCFLAIATPAIVFSQRSKLPKLL